MNTVANKETPHILLVDDDRLVLATLAASLARAGYAVSTAKSSVEAEEMLACGRRPNLVILDVRMPGQSGLFLAERLRELDHIPFLMLSAYSDERIVQLAIAQGALAFLVKPIDEAQLLPAIEAALARADELNKLRTTHKQLQDALDSERSINVAVGVTMMQYRLERGTAFEQLRRAARSRSMRLVDIAAEVVRGCEAMAADRTA
ncbi:ANTAR domain-containing response regulator [Rhodoferax sp. WC2427]|uniref:ANTAR domain-containing response regulator n=1 Tax=Rhodoferax sp. WC2427 TaxID=3234144 RepID=UPI0034659516